MQQQLHAALAAAATASQQAAQETTTAATLEEQLRAQASDANDLLSVMNGMRETLSQQQHAISKLVAKRARAEDRAKFAEERCEEAEARGEQHLQHVQELQAKLKDATISLQLHQAVSERSSSETSSLLAAHQQKMNDLKESHKLELQLAQRDASTSQERMCAELDALRSANALQQQQMQTEHEQNLKVLQANLEEVQQRNMQLSEDLQHAQADCMNLLQQCDTLRNSMSEEAAAFCSKLNLAAAAASQSYSQMIAAQEAQAMREGDLDAHNKQLLAQIQELTATLAASRTEVEQQQQFAADTASSARAAAIAQHIAESALQLEKESTVLHRSRADSAEKLLEESARMRADVQVVFAAAADELADALSILRSEECDAPVASLACGALLRMLHHMRPVLVDPNRLDAAAAALEEICAATASQAGKKIAAVAVAAADAMREADELRSRCSHQEQQLQAYLSQSLDTAAFNQQLQQMHLRIDSMTASLEEEHHRHQVLVEEKKQLENFCSKAAADAVGAGEQHDNDTAELKRMQIALQDLQAKLDLSIQEKNAAMEAEAKSAASAAHLQAERDNLIADANRLAGDAEQLRLAVQATEIRLKEEENTARVLLEQELLAAQQCAATEIKCVQAAAAEANGRAAHLSKCLADLQLEMSEDKRKEKEAKDSAAVTMAQLEADHAQLLRDCELLHAYQSETLQELQQLQSLHDELLAERNEIEAAAAAHAEEQDRRLQEVSEAAAAAESERAQLLQHLHLSQEENLQLHRQQQADEREKNALQCAVTEQNEAVQQHAAAKLQQLQVQQFRLLIATLVWLRVLIHCAGTNRVFAIGKRSAVEIEHGCCCRVHAIARCRRTRRSNHSRAARPA